jgi:hypothetical protein
MGVPVSVDDLADVQDIHGDFTDEIMPFYADVWIFDIENIPWQQ